MSYTLKIDDEGDIDIVSEKVQTIEDTDKIGQDLYILLKTLIGEDIVNPSFGTDWIAVYENPTENYIEQIIRDSVENYPKLVSINELIVTIDANDDVQITLTITTEDGSVITTEAVI